MIPDYYIRQYNVHINDSWKYPKESMLPTLRFLRIQNPHSDVWLRTDKDLRREWAVHNLCYRWGINRMETEHVGLNYPQKWWEKIGYGIFGRLALLLIK